MTEEALCNLVLETAGKTEKELPRFRILALVKDALLELAQKLAASNDREQRELLRKTFTVTSDVNGIASLTTPITATEPLLLEPLEKAEIYLAGIARRLTLLPDETAVKRDRTPGFPFGTLIGTDLLVYNGGSAFQGTVTIRGAYVPTLANLKKELNELLVQIVTRKAIAPVAAATT